MICFLCQQRNFRLVYTLKNKNIYRCQNDGLFLTQVTDNKNNLYSKAYFNCSPYSSINNFNRRYFENKLKTIISLTGEKKPLILDVGCGWGNFLEILKENKINHLGIDTSTKAIHICRSKNLNCRQIDTIGLLKKPKTKFSAITCFQVVEHLTGPLSFLFSIKKLLKPKGILLLTTPNNNSPLRRIFGSRWSVYNTASHFAFYNPETLTKTLIKAGFKKVSVKFDNLRFLSLGYILNRLINLKSPMINIVPIPTDPWGDLEAVGYN